MPVGHEPIARTSWQPAKLCTRGGAEETFQMQCKTLCADVAGGLALRQSPMQPGTLVAARNTKQRLKRPSGTSDRGQTLGIRLPRGSNLDELQLLDPSGSIPFLLCRWAPVWLPLTVAQNLQGTITIAIWSSLRPASAAAWARPPRAAQPTEEATEWVPRLV